MDGLCHRCEHRAQYLETGGRYQPRCECGMTGRAVWTCYLFQPVKPLLLERNEEEDPRPLSPGYFSCRFHIADSQPDWKLQRQTQGNDRALFYWMPRGDGS